MARVAINGFGRIGRAFLRLTLNRDDYEVVAINDLGDPKNLAYLLKYDTAFGQAPFAVEASEEKLKINGRDVKFLSEKDPAKLPWQDLDIDVVVEATGVFASYQKAKTHLTAGAKRVVVSAPVKDEPQAADVKGATVLVGANHTEMKDLEVTSNASCTTNAASPLIGILKEKIGVKKALLNTIHGYTTTQSLVDSPNHKDWRRGRAAALNIVPSSTGAAVATTKAYQELTGKFDGIAIRVPVLVGSIVDITFVANQPTNKEAVNDILRQAASDPVWSRVFAVTDEPLVSSDIIGSSYGAIADLSMTRVVDGDLVKVMAWYDNETGYAHTLAEHVGEAIKHL